jgi:two-component system sensor histidine kinase AlgZ
VEHFPFLARNTAIGAIIAGIILRYFYIAHQRQLQARAESEARLKALQARIRPHFLFNSLNTVASLAHDRPDLAERALEDLADLIRASLGDGAGLVPFSDEVALARGYLELERLRLGERLQVLWELDDMTNTVPVPPLVLQPLVENAVFHGVEPRLEGGTVRVAARMEGGGLLVEVSNPEPATADALHRDGNRMALENIRQRLAGRWGGAASLTMEQGSGEYHVRLRIPEGGRK